MLISPQHLAHTLFIDIETVSCSATYQDLDERMQGLWAKKAKSLSRQPDMSETEVSDLYVDRAAIYSEFAKVVCVSVGYLIGKAPDKKLRLKSFYGHDEQAVLQQLSDMLEGHFDDLNKHKLCGHNIKEFDIPFLCRRMVINNVKIPSIINIAGKKPWEVGHLLDTMQMWKFGDYKNFTSLNLLTAVMGIPSPKDDIDGSEVGRVYHQEDDIIRIVQYCEKDVITVTQLGLKWADRPMLEDFEIESTTEGLG
jgi:DNA polymerase elongation subunit (family B)